MVKHFEGKLLGKGLRFGLVISRFNEFVNKKLLEGAQDALLRHDVSEEDIGCFRNTSNSEKTGTNQKL